MSSTVHRNSRPCDPVRTIRRQTSNYVRHVVASATQVLAKTSGLSVPVSR